MKSISKIVLGAAAFSSALLPTLAAAHDAWFCGPRQPLIASSNVVDSAKGHQYTLTYWDSTNQAPNTWEDWVWRGKSSGIAQFCPDRPGVVSCTFSWSGSKTVSYSHTNASTSGWSFSSAPYAVSVSKYWLTQESKTDSTTQSWSANSRFAPGYYAEPVIAVARRWKSGYFAGYFVPQVQIKGGWEWGCGDANIEVWAYNWDTNRRNGTWTKNVAELTYKMFFVTDDNNKL